MSKIIPLIGLLMFSIFVFKNANASEVGHYEELPSTTSNTLIIAEDGIRTLEQTICSENPVIASLPKITDLERREFLKDLINIKDALPCGITHEEGAALQYYVGGGYRVINSALRNEGESSKKIQYLATLINNGLGRLANYIGPVIRVVGKLPPEIISKHTVNKIVVYKAFTSTSTRLTAGFDSIHTFFIYSKTGRFISRLPGIGLPHEKEVLFPAGAKFRVLKKIVNDVGGFDFELEEVL